MSIVDLGLDLDRFGGHDPKAELLRLSLALAVPLRIAQYQSEERSTEWLIEHARHVWGEHCAGLEHESLLYACKARTVRGVKYPGTAQVFNWFAEAVACAALVADGGITVLGLHFCAGQCGRCNELALERQPCETPAPPTHPDPHNPQTNQETPPCTDTP